MFWKRKKKTYQSLPMTPELLRHQKKEELRKAVKERKYRIL